MADFVFQPPAPASVAIPGTDARFPVRRIFCVGRNYAAHSRSIDGLGGISVAIAESASK